LNPPLRRTYRDKATGERKRAAKWYVEFTDHHDLQRRIPATTDKRASEEIGRWLDKLVAVRIAHDQPSGDLARWLESLPASMIERLVKLDLLDSRRLAAGQPISEHIADYRDWMKQRGRSEKHIAGTIQRIQRVCKAAGAAYWSTLFGRIDAALAKVQADRNLTHQSRNGHLTAVRMFCNWVVKQGRAAKSPAATVERLQVESKEHRRALSEAEAARLIAAAAEGEELTGADRQPWRLTRIIHR